MRKRIHCHGCGRVVWAELDGTCHHCQFVNAHGQRYGTRRVSYKTTRRATQFMPTVECDCGTVRDFWEHLPNGKEK